MMKKNCFSQMIPYGCILCLVVTLYGCSESVVDKMIKEKKYTPLTVYFSGNYPPIDLFPDFVNYPNDLVKYGLRDSVQEVSIYPYSFRKFDEKGNMTYYADWLDSNHRFGDSYALEYDENGKLSSLYNVRTRGGSGASDIYVYDEQGRLKERNSQYYTRTYKYDTERKDSYAVTTALKNSLGSATNDFTLNMYEENLTMKLRKEPQGYWDMTGYTQFSAKISPTQLCEGMVRVFYPDKRSNVNKLDSIISTYTFSYNDKEDLSQSLIHTVEYPSGKVWDCQIDYTYEYDTHGNWTYMRYYSTDLRRLFGDFENIMKDQNGRSYAEMRRTITYYETKCQGAVPSE